MVEPLTISGIPLDILDNFILLGITLSSILTWNQHVTNICAKASKRLYGLRILKQNGIPPRDLTTVFPHLYALFWNTHVQSGIRLSLTLFDLIEHVQDRPLKIVFLRLSNIAFLNNLQL